MKTPDEALADSQEALPKFAEELGQSDGEEARHPASAGSTPGEHQMIVEAQTACHRLSQAQTADRVQKRDHHAALSGVVARAEDGQHDPLPEDYAPSGPGWGDGLVLGGAVAVAAGETYSVQPAIATLIIDGGIASWVLAALVGAGAILMAHLTINGYANPDGSTRREREEQRRAAGWCLVGLLAVALFAVFGRVQAITTTAALDPAAPSLTVVDLVAAIGGQAVLVALALALAWIAAMLERRRHNRAESHYLADSRDGHDSLGRQLETLNDIHAEQREALHATIRNLPRIHRAALVRSHPDPLASEQWQDRTEREIADGSLVARLFPFLPSEENAEEAPPATRGPEQATEDETQQPEPDGPEPGSPADTPDLGAPDPVDGPADDDNPEAGGGALDGIRERVRGAADEQEAVDGEVDAEENGRDDENDDGDDLDLIDRIAG